MSFNFKKHHTYLTPLFTNQSLPKVSQPVLKITKKEIKTKDWIKKQVDKVSSFDKDVCTKNIEIFTKEEYALELTVQSLYNVVWEQCLELIQTILQVEKVFDELKKELVEGLSKFDKSDFWSAIPIFQFMTS